MRHILTDLRGNPIYETRRTRHNNVLPTLFYLVQNRTWTSVISRAKSHPREIVFETSDGNTPLHIACRFNPPPAVVEALIVAASIKNHQGATPCHVAACHLCSAESLSLLLHQVSELSRMGRAPIHYACMSFRGLEPDAFKLLFEETLKQGNLVMDEEENENEETEEETNDNDNDDDFSKKPKKRVNVLTLRDSTGQTPLSLLFRRYRERVRCVISSVERRPLALAAALTVQADLGELWVKARWIVARLTEWQNTNSKEQQQNQDTHTSSAVALQAAAWAAERHNNNNNRFRIVHASVGLTGYGCPPEMIRLAISLHPDQVLEMDHDGNLPLHLAAVAPSFLTCQENNNNSHQDENDSVFSGLSFLSSTCSSNNAFDKVIRSLLSQYPAAARIPQGRTGRLPFQMAIQANRRTWDDGIRTLLSAYPPALHSSKIDVKLYPTILAALCCCCNIVELPLPMTTRNNNKNNNNTRKRGLTTMFELLKAKPDLVAYNNNNHEPVVRV